MKGFPAITSTSTISTTIQHANILFPSLQHRNLMLPIPTVRLSPSCQRGISHMSKTLWVQPCCSSRYFTLWPMIPSQINVTIPPAELATWYNFPNNPHHASASNVGEPTLNGLIATINTADLSAGVLLIGLGLVSCGVATEVPSYPPYSRPNRPFVAPFQNLHPGNFCQVADFRCLLRLSI